MTFPERLLWSRLRGGRCNGSYWRRQHPVDRFVVDFCCEEFSLVVEIDGLSHVGNRDSDDVRQQIIESHGYVVMRVTNDDVIGDVDSVLTGILRLIETLPPSGEVGSRSEVDGGMIDCDDGC